MSNFATVVRRQAESKFGKENERAIAEWVGYWLDTGARNRELVNILSSQTEVNFSGKTVLDIGCGTGGLARVVAEQGGSYIGLDCYPGTLEMARAFLSDLPNSPKAGLLQASGPSLPLRDASVDVVAAFDVIEHLVGGEPWQRAFLLEIRRVLRPEGILLLTTPNRLHPFEPHTGLYGAHYLPVPLADRYIRWRNPSFLEEYSTYGEIHLLTPWKMKSLLEGARLRLIPDFPGGLPLERYSPLKRTCLRLLCLLGLGWIAPTQFWIAASSFGPVESKATPEPAHSTVPVLANSHTEKTEVAYSPRAKQEIERFQSVEDVHALPEIFHFWSLRYVRPKLEAVFGVSTLEDFYLKHIFQYRTEHPDQTVEITSLGAGNSDMEIQIAKLLLDRGLADFRFSCLDINPAMLVRGRELASENGLADHFEFLETDVEHWQPANPVSVVMAHHSLHHIVNLEVVFESIRKAIGKEGYLVSCDMIGRNGHMRWPEALDIIHNIWRTMPDRYKYNHPLRRFEEMYENWDCSKEGFEGIRAQDILPLLVQEFAFEAFIAYGNLPDIFTDRNFGHNFDVGNQEDTEFIDRIGALNDRLIGEGVVKPTQMIASLRGFSAGEVRCYEHWTPEFCIRKVRQSRGLGSWLSRCRPVRPNPRRDKW